MELELRYCSAVLARAKCSLLEGSVKVWGQHGKSMVTEIDVKFGGALEVVAGMTVGIGVFLVTVTILVYWISPVSVGAFNAQPAPKQYFEDIKVAEQGGGGVMRVSPGIDSLLAVRVTS